jgi:hypothetical protein
MGGNGCEGHLTQVPWIAQRSLETIWRAADAWLVGYFMLMPDHLHLFCAPRDLRFTGRISINRGSGNAAGFITVSAVDRSFMKNGFTCRRILSAKPSWRASRTGHIREQCTTCAGNRVDAVRTRSIRLPVKPERVPFTRNSDDGKVRTPPAARGSAFGGRHVPRGIVGRRGSRPYRILLICSHTRNERDTLTRSNAISHHQVSSP